MADHSPTEVARLLGVKDATLRVWAKEYAALLSPSAAASGPKVRRRYQDSDIAQLRTVQALLRNGATHEQVRAQIAAGQLFAATDNSEIPETEADSPIGENHKIYDYSQGAVTVLDQAPELAALRQLLDAQRETLEAQQMIVASQSQVIKVQCAQLDALERGLADAYQQSTDERARLQEELEHTRTDLVGQLSEVRGQVERLPRWLRVLLGLGV